MSKVIAVANQKGGVGKTTTAINLSSALSHFGRKVLLVDMDPQGNAGRGLGIDITVQKNTIYEVLMGYTDIQRAILKTSFDGLQVIPANLRLASLEASASASDPLFLLSKVLKQLPENQFDYIILDCPPSLGLLCLNALIASNSVLIPVQCEYFAMEAVASILATITKFQHYNNPTLHIEGFLLTMYDARTNLGTEISTQVRGLFKENTFLTSIPRNQSVQESQGLQMPVTSFRPSFSGALAYFSLAREVMDHEER